MSLQDFLKEEMPVMEEKGLKKSLSRAHAFSLCLGCIIGWGAFVMPGSTFLVKGGPLGTVIAVSLTALIMMVIAVNIAYMLNLYPNTGGAFVFTEKMFGKGAGFACAWFLVLAYLAIVPLNATALALIGRTLWNIVQFGFHYMVAGYEMYFGEILLGLDALLVLAVVSISGARQAGKLQMLFVGMLVFGTAAAVLSALVSGRMTFAHMRPLFSSSVSPFAGILALTAIGPWAFVGFDTLPHAVEEMDFPVKKSKGIMISSILAGALIYISLTLFTACVVPDGYENWEAYISDLNNLSGLISQPTFYAAKEILGTFGIVCLAIAAAGAIFSGILGFYMAGSRLLYSMSLEGYLPAWFSGLEEDYETPKNAIWFIFFVSFAATLLGRTALGWIVDISSFGAAVGYFCSSLSAMKQARRENNTWITMTGCIGAVMGVLFAVLLLIPVNGISAGLSAYSYGFLGLWVIAGFVFYLRMEKRGGEKNDEESK